MLRRCVALAFILLFGGSAVIPAREAPEFRALWVDAFHEGIRSPQEADALVAAARRANINTLIVQVRRRGDALYTKTIEPALDDPAYDPAFDALAYIVEAGHRAGIQVHAWVNAMPVWRDEAAPKDPRHLFNRHGPHASGADNWLTSSPEGNHKFPVGYFLDPGHPAAAEYLAEIYLGIVRNYPVDGIHFDYIRYPETEERLARGAAVGYNAVALERFRRATGRTDTPAPGDEQWMRWRREQVTNLVRRVSIEAKAINPRIKISAALIPWGEPPSRETDFEDSSPMQRVFQNWHQWLHDGLLDLGVPMNYATETDARVRGWFDGWMRWEKQHGHGRHLAVGLGAYRNTPAHTLAQIARARTAASGRVIGVSFFSYAVPMPPAARENGVNPPADIPASERLAFLADGADGLPGAFPHPAPVPPMPWIERPEHGWLAGTVAGTTRAPSDGIVVRITRKRLWPFGNTSRVRTDGNGFFGLAKVKPGRYTVATQDHGGAWRSQEVRVAGGRVTRADF